MEKPSASKTPDTLLGPERRILLLENIQKNIPSDLLQVLAKLPDEHKKICLTAVDGSNLLEFAILNSYWNSAHVLVHFIVGGRCDESYFRPTYNTHPVTWAKAIHLIVKHYLKMREIPSLQNEKYQAVLKERMKAYFKAHTYGCVNLFEAVNYPRTFILLTQLGANIRGKDDKIYHLLTSNTITFNVKLTLMRYIKRVASDLLKEPCGVLGAPPVLYCYVHNYVAMLKGLNVPFDEVLELRTTSGKSLAHLIAFKHMKRLLTSEQRLKLFTQHGALDTLLERSKFEHQSFFFPEIVQAFESIVAAGKHPIPRLAARLENPHLIVYLQKLGVSNIVLEGLRQWDGRPKKPSAISVNSQKNVANLTNMEQIPHALPSDMLVSISEYLTIQDMVSMFSVTKAMRHIYQSESLPWKSIARNTFNKLKFQVCAPSHSNNAAWRLKLLSESQLASNWIQQKFTVREIAENYVHNLTLSEHWGVWSNYTNYTFWNCQTDEKKVLNKQSALSAAYSGICFIESSPGSDPIVAVGCGGTYWGLMRDPTETVAIFSPNGILSTIKLPTGSSLNAFGVSSLGTGHLIAGENMCLIDLAQEKVVSKVDCLYEFRTVNKFTTSPTVIAVSKHFKDHICWLDQDLIPIRKLEMGGASHSIRSIHAINEHRIIVTSTDGWKSLDDRFLTAKNMTPFNFPLTYPGNSFYGKYSLPKSSVVAIDEVNERMILHIPDFSYSMLWDLKTLKWKNIYSEKEELTSIAINSRYQVVVTADTRQAFIRDYAQPSTKKDEDRRSSI